jgi:hypothetical protein
MAVLAVCICGFCLPAAVPAQPGDAGSETGSNPGPAYSCPDLTLGPVMPPAPDRTGAPLIVYARELDAARTRVGEARGAVER